MSDVIVEAEYHGQGIGRKLVEACLQKLQSDMIDFLESNRRYESNGSPNLKEQREWMNSLT